MVLKEVINFLLFRNMQTLGTELREQVWKGVGTKLKLPPADPQM